MCEEFESLRDRSGQPDVVMGQSIVLSEIKAKVPLETQELDLYWKIRPVACMVNTELKSEFGL